MSRPSCPYSVLGMDPGLNCTGYSIIEMMSGGYRLIACGTFRTPGKAAISDRLNGICTQLQEVLNGFRPDHAAVEETFVAQNAKTALLLGHIRGALLLTIAQFGIPTFEYSPKEIKKAVVGYGSASKCQVRAMLTNILRMDIEKYPLDATDALAVAICHCHTNGSRWAACGRNPDAMRNLK
ncbi:crossover junction endodeoxyribonuclease RuvC [bacterium]|nr:crossover junction endodeoxyribonuclease RuvC [bacterium]